MRAGLTGIDHAVVLVRDLNAAEVAWRRLGFTTTPRGFHSLGSSNHCLMFRRGYIELLAMPAARPAAMTHFFDFLARREGLGGFAFACGDAIAAHSGFVADGFAPAAPVEFTRPVARAGNREARFRIVQLPADTTPGMHTFVCQHLTPELVWLDEDLEHANGAIALAGLAVASDEPAAWASRYARLAGVAVAGNGEVHAVRIGTVQLDFATAQVWAARLPGLRLPQPAGAVALRVQVADPARARAALQGAAVNAVPLPGGAIGVGCDAANGVAVIFAAA